jgi:hypothetical protein
MGEAVHPGLGQRLMLRIVNDKVIGAGDTAGGGGKADTRQDCGARQDCASQGTGTKLQGQLILLRGNRLKIDSYIPGGMLPAMPPLPPGRRSRGTLASAPSYLQMIISFKPLDVRQNGVIVSLPDNPISRRGSNKICVNR